MEVSILGMLEGVLKEKAAHSFAKGGMGFNPWYVGGGVKRHNNCRDQPLASMVSILGMLEGVLKDISGSKFARWLSGFNPWYVGGGVKR